MKIIPTKLHGILDYPWGIMLIAFPWIFDVHGGVMANLPVILGVMMLTGSLLTDYELGVLRIFSMRTHLFLDIVSALLLASSPWVFGFHEMVYQPHLFVGIIQLLLAIMTSTRPNYSRSAMHP